MAIRADKLYKLILKTDRADITKERYRRILAVEVSNNGKIIGTKGVLRIISRGPFLAMFKHESYSFVHSLENAARSIVNHNLNNTTRKGKKSKAKTLSSSSPSREIKSEDKVDNESDNSLANKDDGLSSSRLTIQSAPCVSRKFERQKRRATVIEKPSSLKRKKSDKTGMIITTDTGCCDEEMSTVSVSPLNTEDSVKVEQKHKQSLDSIEEKTTTQQHRIMRKDNTKMKESTRKSRSSKSKIESARRSSSKSKRRLSHDRTVNGRQIQSPITLFNHESSQGTSSLYQRSDMGHSRCDSALESITNIREVMQAHESPKSHKRLKMHHSSLLSHAIHSAYGIPTFPHPAPYSAHPMIYQMPYSSMYPAPWMQHNDQSYQETEEYVGNENENNCFIFGPLFSFVKGLFCNHEKVNNNRRRQATFVPTYMANREICFHNTQYPYQPSQWQSMPFNIVASRNPYDIPDNNHLLGAAPPSNYTNHCNHDIDQESRYNNSIGSSPGETISDVTGSLSKDYKASEDYGARVDQYDDSSHKLKMYDFKPSIPLPEPEIYHYKYNNNQEQKLKRPRVYDCAAANDWRVPTQSNNVEQKLEPLVPTDNNQSRISAHSINDRFQINNTTDSTFQAITTELSNTFISELKKTDCDLSNDSSVEKNSSIPSMIGSSKSDPQKMTRITNAKDCKSHQNMVEDTTSQALKMVQIESGILDAQSSSTATMDIRDNNEADLKTVRHRPKDISRSRSLSDDRRSKLSQCADTLSLTRTYSVGSSVSSLSSVAAASMNQQQRRQQNVRYHHYR